MAHAPRQRMLPGGVEKFSRSKMYVKKALYKKKKVAVPKKVVQVPKTKTVEVGGAKNGKTRVVPVKRARGFYPAENVPVPLKSRKNPKPTKLRSSITPGTVLIMLAGKFRGKKVVFLKQLPSGLLMVTGPYKINHVPLRRVNQAYVIATQTKVDVSSLVLPETLNDFYFKKPEEKQSKKPTEEGLFKDDKKKEKKPIDAARVAQQKAVDTAVLASVKKVPQLASYLARPFSLKRGQFPHLMKF